MAIKKEYQHENVRFGFNVQHRKWNFTVTKPDNTNHTLLFACGGKEVASKVAGIVCGAFKRTKGNGLDGLAKANIEKVLSGEVKPLLIARHQKQY